MNPHGSIPKWRDEDGLPVTMSWIRNHSTYYNDTLADRIASSFSRVAHVRESRARLGFLTFGFEKRPS